jgi:hypothetical protein
LSDIASQQYDGQEIDLEITLSFKKSPDGYFAVKQDIGNFITGCGQYEENGHIKPAKLNRGNSIDYFCTMPL